MAQQDPIMEKAFMSAIPLLHPEIIDQAKAKIEALFEVQKELVHTIEEINLELFNRAKAEAELASEFVTKLSAVRSVPDATTTYHTWASREMELLAANGRQMIANGEKFMQASRRLFPNGFWGSVN
jgi:hypothetical protein